VSERAERATTIIDLPVVAVTVLEDRASVTRRARLPLRAGQQRVVIDRVSPALADKTLAASCVDRTAPPFGGAAGQAQVPASGHIELSAADAMEFLYTYTWGPASFPYEVREQYGILPYDDYVVNLRAWCEGGRVVELPPALRSYLQPGYRDHLAGKIELADEHDRAVELPDSNCLIAIEKP
jgi:hypothetical protein